MSERAPFPGLSLDGLVALVTGGGSGIGLETALTFADLGARVAVLDWTPGAAAAAVKRIEELGRPALAFEGNVGDEKTVVGAFEATRQQFGPVDIAVACAGVLGEGGPVFTTSVEDFEQVMGVNVRGPFLCTRAVLPAMLRQGSGHVITIASIAGLVAFPQRCAYTASKGAAVMFTKSVAADYAAHGIRANAVCPGFVQSPMTQWRLDVPGLRASVEARIPMGRVARVEEIANAVAMLASDSLTYLTGHALVIDGGWTVL